MIDREIERIMENTQPMLSPLTGKPMERRTNAAEQFYKNEAFAIMRQYWLCETGNEFEDETQMAENVAQAESQYRAKHKLTLLDV